ncbi:MAG: LysR substrate-binding domain-containing protein [Candidatus Symbiobacter sp.]|nr:LysR substrate-binding domain-containing protein [Candidatus Symbiobacter sp.]
MLDWDKLRVFLATAEAGSFTHAGEILQISQSSVSRQINALEESLGVHLFHRHARGLIVTEQGEVLLSTTKEIFDKLAFAEARIQESMVEAQGSLRVTTTVTFGATWLSTRIAEFMEIYPKIALTLRVDDRELDLGMREADVAVRLTPPRQVGLIQRQLTVFHFQLYAAQSYLDRFGTPKSLAELSQHRLVTYGEEAGEAPFEGVDWIVTAGGHDLSDRVVLRVNNFTALHGVIATGGGIGLLPEYLARNDARLVPVLPENAPPSVPAYFVYPEELRQSKRIGVLRDFLLKKVAENPF